MAQHFTKTYRVKTRAMDTLKRAKDKGIKAESKVNKDGTVTVTVYMAYDLFWEM